MCGRAIDLCHIRRLVLVEERFDPGQGVDEIASQLGVGSFAKHDPKRDSMSNDSFTLVRDVANALVMRERDSAIAAAMLEPLLVGALGREEVVVPLDRQAGCGEDVREAFTEIAVREVDTAHAARS